MTAENSALGFCDESKSMSMIKRINKTHALHAWRRPSDLHRKRIETYQSTMDTPVLLYAHLVLRYLILSSAPFSIQRTRGTRRLVKWTNASKLPRTNLGFEWRPLGQNCYFDALLPHHTMLSRFLAQTWKGVQMEEDCPGIGLDPLTASPQPYKVCRVTQPFFLWGFCFCFFVTCQLIVSFSAMEIVVFCKPLNQLKGMVPYYRASLCCRWDWTMRKQSRTS